MPWTGSDMFVWRILAGYISIIFTTLMFPEAWLSATVPLMLHVLVKSHLKDIIWVSHHPHQVTKHIG